MYKKCLGNRVTCHEGEWRCHLCHYSMRFFEVEEHSLSDLHQANLSQIDEEQRKLELNRVLELSGKECKKIVRNLITFDNSSSFFDCSVCKCKLDGLSKTLQHIDGSSHSQNFTNFIEQNEKTFEKKAEQVSRNKVVVNKADAGKSVQVSISVLESGFNDISCDKRTDCYHNNINNIEITTTPGMFKKFLENRITCTDQVYECHLCQYVLEQRSFDNVEEHLQTEMHQEKLNEIDEEQRKKESCKMLECSEEQQKKIVENLIIFGKTFSLFDCCVCMCKISGLSNVLQHINGVSHRKEWVKYIEQNNQAIEKETKKVSWDESTIIKAAIDKSSNVQAANSVCQSELAKITYDKNTNSHYCNICKIQIIASPNISQHTQGLLHQALESKLKNSSFNPTSKTNVIIYDEKCNSFYCNICKHKIVSSPNIDQHIQGFLHQTMSRTPKTVKTNNINITSQSQIDFRNKDPLQTKKVGNSVQEIVLQENSLKSCFTEIGCCQHCQVYLENNAAAQYHVMLHLIKELELWNEFDILKCEFVTNENVYLECLLCNFSCASSMVRAHEVLEKHFEMEMHRERLKFFKHTIKGSGLEYKDSQINSLDLKTLKHNPVIFTYLLCNVCDVPIPCTSKNSSEHVSGKRHMTTLKNKENDTIIVKNIRFDRNDRSYYKCFMCDLSFISASILFDHYETADHKWKIKALKMIEECSYTNFHKSNNMTINTWCSLCNTFLYNFKCTVDHILGRIHTKKLKSLPSKLEIQMNSNTKPVAQVINKLEHLSLNHKKIVQKQENNAAPVGVHNMSVIKTKNLKRVKKVINLEASIEELNQLGFSTENIQPLSTIKSDTATNVLDNLVSLNFSDSQTKRLPSLAKTKLPRTPKIGNQRNTFATNVLLNGNHYINFCINSGLKNIYNFDYEKINILKLGVSLTFPFQANRVCLPCAQQFPDDVQSLFEHLQQQEHLNNIYQMQIEDKEFEKFPEQFSDLKLGKLYMQDVSDESIECLCCNIKIVNQDENIKHHADTLTHKEKSTLWKEESNQLFDQYLTIYKDIWYYAEVFFCEICKKKCEFEIDFGMHLIHPEHMKKVYELKCKGVALTFDLCPSCITYWFGKTDSYEHHCKSNFHKRFAKNKDFMVPNLIPNASKFLDSIDENVDFLENESNKVNLGKDNKETVLLKAIIETIKPTYPNAKAYIFGSRLSHLGFPDSDVDVFLDLENVYYTSSTQEQSQKYIKSIKSHFESTPNVWVVDEVLLATRVPIMKLRHIPTNLKCDFSFINGLSVEKSRLIGLYNIAFPTCRKLILFMKKWLTLCRIFGSDYITTFAISWCVIFYLQLQRVLPTVHELFKSKKESKIVDGWECGFVEKFSAEKSSLSFKEHLKGFFTYFANFDYQKNVICPYLGKAIDKRIFVHEHTDQLPTEMNIYKERLKKKEVEIFRFDSPMCIQDPIDLSQNMTKAVKKQQLRCFRQYCVLSAEKC